MINDECDCIDCHRRAIYECEQIDNIGEPSGNYVFVCQKCYEADKDKLIKVRSKPNKDETNIFKGHVELDEDYYNSLIESIERAIIILEDNPKIKDVEGFYVGKGLAIELTDQLSYLKGEK